MAFEIINPLTNHKIKEIQEHTEKDIEVAISLAYKAYDKWREVSFKQRAEHMKLAAKLMRSRKNQYAQIMTDEMGKSLREGKSEIDKCALVCEHYAFHAEEYLAREKLPVDEGEAYIEYNPIGIVLAIMPWNFPFWQVFRFAAPNLMAGNVGLLKHAANVPQCSLAIEEVLRDAGFPSGTFASLLIKSDKVKLIIEDERVKAVTLTGSEAAGSNVASLAGKHIKKTVLELGGSDPFIVLADADLEKASEVAVKSRMINCGQSCIAAKRFIVEESVAEKFLKKFKEKMSAIKLGDPNDESVDYGPLAREDLAEKLLEQVKKSVDKGAKVILGGDRPDKKGAFFNPTILTNVKPGMPAYDEELFGPVATVFSVKNEEEAVKIANDSPYGLGGSIWTQDLDRGKKLASKVASGAVYVNAMMASDVRMPFGGVKNSGYGRELSHLGIREFMNTKTVWVKD